MSTNRPIVFLIGLGVSLTLLGVAGWQWHRANVQTEIAREQTKKAEAQTRIAESRRLAALSDAVRPERLDLAMLLALEAAKEGDTLEARGSLQRSLDARPEVVRFLHVPEGDVRSVAFGPEGKIAVGYSGGGVRGGGVVLFDARGERLRPAPLEVKEGDVTSVAFGPEGKIAAGYGVGFRVGGVVVFDARGERLRPAPLEVKEGSVTSVAFGPEGKIAAGYSVFGRGSGGVVVFDVRGERLRPAPLEVKEGSVTSVAFGPEGKIAAGYGGGGVSGGGVVVFDVRGERLRPAPLEVKEGSVTSVAFGPEGKIAAGYGGGGVSGGGVVLFDARGERLRPAPLEVKEGSVTSVAFGPEGKIAAGYRRRRRGALRRPWRAAPTRAAGGQGGLCHERGLRAGGQDRRGICAAAAAWCSSTPGASGSDPRRWRSRRAMSRAWPSGRRARSPRDISRPRRRRGALRRRSRLVAAEGGADGQSQLHAARVDAVLPRDPLPPHDPIPALAA